MKPQLYIATNGLGVWYTNDLGENLIHNSTTRLCVRSRHITPPTSLDEVMPIAVALASLHRTPSLI